MDRAFGFRIRAPRLPRFIQRPTASSGFKMYLLLLKEKPELATIPAETITNEGYYRSLYQQAKAAPAPRRSIAEIPGVVSIAPAKVIPGAAQTFSKGYTQYVRGVAPISCSAARAAASGTSTATIHRLRSGLAAGTFWAMPTPK